VCPTDDDDVRTFKAKIKDMDDGVTAYSASVTVLNVAPTVSLTGARVADEGDTVSYSYTVSDPGADTFALDDESCGAQGVLSGSTFDGATGAGSFVCTFPDGPATTEVSVTVRDDDGGVGSDSLTVDVDNVAPQIEQISVPLDPVDIGDQSGTSVNVTFGDPAGAYDEPYTCAFDMDNDGEDDVTVKQVTGTSCSGALSYALPGVYTVRVTVTDKDEGWDSDVATGFIVVYDPEGGFVTGGGWIDSPEGAYTPDPSLTGKANFGFVSKYKKEADTPTGQTEFQFKVADLNFHSDSYQWLVVAGSKAKYKGEGTINGAGHYGFMISAIDARLTPSTDVDLFRIKIWDKHTDEVVYDNQLEADDNADPTTAIGGGSIVIHKK
jgi:hypothetical protein